MADLRIPRTPREDPIPLSYFQESLWFLEQLHPNTPSRNIALRLRVPAKLDSQILQRSLDEVVSRHESLRTFFRVRAGLPEQVVRPEATVPLAVVDLTGEADAQLQGSVSRRGLKEARKVFRIDQDLLLRATLLQLRETSVVLLTVHHLVADGASMDLIVRELFSIYTAFANDRPTPLPMPQIQYGDFSIWQKQQSDGKEFDRQIHFWKRQLENAPATLNLPVDRTAPDALRPAGRVASTVIIEDLTKRLRAFAASQRASVFMLLLTAFQILLYRCSGQPNVVVGVPISSRDLLELESAVGLFVNTLPVRSDFSTNPTFAEAFAQVRNTVFEAHQNKDIPFHRLVRELRPTRVADRNPFFETLFTFRNRVEAGQLSEDISDTTSTESPGFTLSLSVDEYSDALRVELEYRTDIFRDDRAAALLDIWKRILANGVDDPQTRVDDISLCEPSDLAPPSNALRIAEHAANIERFVDEVIFENMSSHPEREAVRSETGALTYGQLMYRVEEAARRLHALGVQPDDVVALCVDRSVESVVGLLAILRSGAAFMPLDPKFPSERLEYMLGDAQPVAVLVVDATKEKVRGFSAPLVQLDDLSHATAQSAVSARSLAPRRHENLAYVIYTSGSTGAPKGVEVPHRALTNFMSSMQELFAFGAADSWLAVTTISFDIAIFELLFPLLCGGRVVLASRAEAMDGVRLAALLTDHQITFMQATPRTWRLLLATNWKGSEKLRVLCGGEAWGEDLAQALLARAHSVWNLYGPTETTIWSAFNQIKQSGEVLIGPPIANTGLHVLAANLQPLPADIPGELYIGGLGLARGYRGRPDLTAQRFVHGPSNGGRQEVIYKTGDRVRRLPSGELEFLGRADNQIKFRGFRIEPNEIAAVMNAFPGIAESVVVLHGHDEAEQNLVGYFTGVGDEEVKSDDLRKYLSGKLPDYMTPVFFERLTAIPMTPNNKIDRRALEDRKLEIRLAQGAKMAPRTAVEGIIAQTWSELLKVQGLGVNEDLFSLGAHSMMVVQAIDNLNRTFGLQLSVAEVFEQPTIEGLARIVEARREGPWTPRAIPLNDGGPETPIIFVYAGPAEHTLAQMIDDRAVFGIEVPWPTQWKDAIVRGDRAEYPKMDDFVEMFYAEVKKRWNGRPCILAGYSFAGLLAFEVARRVIREGGEVEAVVVIDKWLAHRSSFSIAFENLIDGWRRKEAKVGLGTISGRMARSVLVLRWLLESLVKEMSSRVWLRPNDLTSFLDQEGRPLRWKYVERLYVEWERAYQPEPLDTEGIVFRPEFVDRYQTVRRREVYLGWDKLFVRGVSAFVVPGDHFSIVRKHAEVLGRLFADAVRMTRRGRPSAGHQNR